MDAQHAAAKKPTKIPTFEEIARLYAPKNTPSWLPAHLEWSIQGLRHDRQVDDYRPTKVTTRTRLEALSAAMHLAQHELSDPYIRNLLEASQPIKNISATITTLQYLEKLADLTCSSLLMGPKGTMRGRGKPKVPNFVDPKLFCAAQVVETWLYFRKTEPGLRSSKAAKIAQAYWLASGGKSDGYGNPLNGWYNHFRAVRTNRDAADLKRLRVLWRIDLAQSEKRSKPPWYPGLIL